MLILDLGNVFRDWNILLKRVHHGEDEAKD
jgi:hypothetical protein